MRAEGELVCPYSDVELRGAERTTQSRPPARFLSTTALLGTAHDSSTIDSVHTPTAKHETPPLPEITRIPLLPDNDSPHPGREGPDEGVIRPVIRPEISTVSGDGTHLDVPSAMSEVTDNHAAELDPYDLTSKVAVAASKATTKVEEPGWVKTLWTGLLDDIFGKRKSSKA